MLYVIAGVSLSGKTSARRHITKSRGISGIDSDTLRTMMNELRPDMSVGHTRSSLVNYENMRQCIQAFVHARRFFPEDYLLEGDSIHLEDIKKSVETGEMKAVILGYPLDTVQHRLMILRQNAPASHWPYEIAEQDLIDKVQQYIEYSRFLQQEAKKLNLDFIDVSSGDINSTINAVVTQLFSK